MLRSAFNLPNRQELDIAVRHVAALPNPVVPRYTAVDFRYGWRLRPELELSLVGQNLFDPRHAEFNAAGGRSEIDRSVFLRVRWTP
jgi:iron complex outermembrane receptor protein